jgi:hypothetical protein
MYRKRFEGIRKTQVEAWSANCRTLAQRLSFSISRQLFHPETTGATQKSSLPMADTAIHDGTTGSRFRMLLGINPS